MNIRNNGAEKFVLDKDGLLLTELGFNGQRGIIATQKAGAPVPGDLTNGSWKLFKDTSSGDVKLCYNDGGALKCVTLT